jgi:L-lysine exporter family protein LysE/ArgO
VIAAATGFLASLSLILAIGAQNAFLLRHGLLGRHVLPLCLLFAVSDAVLILAGVMGFGTVVHALPWFPQVLALVGAAFLVIYGAQRLRAAWEGSNDLLLAGQTAPLGATLAMGAAFTWLNPHVYLDTVVLLGAISTRFPGMERAAFGLGAATASFVFFFSLGFGARLLAPLMTSARSWRVLDLGTGLLMLMLAAGLIIAH